MVRDDRTKPGATTGLVTIVYDRLRSDILRGRYRPNQRLIELDLSDELRASRTPIREALQRLTDDGLARRTRQGWIVREFTVHEIGEIYACRAALESYAVRIVASRSKDVDLRQVLENLARQAALQDDPVARRAQTVEINDQFHTLLCELSGNARLIGLIQRNQGYYFNYDLAKLYSDDELTTSLDEHAVIVESVSEGDVERASDLMRRHIETAFALIEAKLPSH